MRNRKRAIKDALNVTRNIRKKAEGGDDLGEAEPLQVTPTGRLYVSPNAAPPQPVQQANVTDVPQPPISGQPEGYQPQANPHPAEQPGFWANLAEDWKRSLQESDEAAYGMHQQGSENMASGNPAKMLLGAGQEVLGAAMPAMAPFAALTGTGTKTGARTGPGLEQAADVAGFINPDMGALGMAMAPAYKAAKYTKKGMEKAGELEENIVKAAEADKKDIEWPKLKKWAESHYPHDLAVAAGNKKLDANEIATIKNFLSPQSQKTFDTHYKKYFGDYPSAKPQLEVVKPSPPPVPQSAPETFVGSDGKVYLKPKADTPFAPLSNFGEGVNPKDLTQTGPQMGSNPGGIYQHPESGNKYYIKEGQTKDHVVNENVAAALYNLAGVPTLKYHMDPAGEHIVTSLADLSKKNAYDLSPQERKLAQQDFAVHAWLANHDVVGTGGDNLGVVNGKVVPLDLGGSLKYRAQGEPKGDTAFNYGVLELDSMRGLDPKISAPDAKKMFGDMTDAEVAESVKRVVNIPNKKIMDAVTSVGGDKELADKLITRKNYLKDWLADHEAANEPPMGPEGWGDEYNYDHGLEPTSSPKEHKFDDIFKDYIKKVNWQEQKPNPNLVAQGLAPPDLSKWSFTEKYKRKASDLYLKMLGFNPDFPLYKGGNLEDYPNKIMDPSGKVMEKAFFLAGHPKIAAAYGKVLPYFARANNAYEIHWGDLVRHIEPHMVNPSGSAHYDPDILHPLVNYARKIGADLVAVHGMHDIGAGAQHAHTQFMVLNPEILRAPHAEFNQAKLKLNHPLAGIAGLPAGAGIYSLASSDDKDEKMAKGGKVPQIDEDPQDHEFINFSRGGMLDSDIPGRTDKIPLRVKPGAYVLPADIPSALGEGNSKAGAEILKKMFTSGPYGLPPPNIHGKEFHYPRPLHWNHVPTPKHNRGGKVRAVAALPADHQLGMKVPKGGSMCGNCKYLATTKTCGNKGFVEWNGGPKLPHPANEYCCDLYEHEGPEKKADGGAADHVPIIAAGGEFIIHPDVVKAIGNGDMKAGHSVLDKFVLGIRKQHIATLKKLKPPK